MTDQIPDGAVTVEEVRSECERWSKHMRKESVSDEWSDEEKIQFTAVAEAYEDLVDLIDNGPTAQEKTRRRMLIRALKEAHGGRKH